MNKYYYNGGLTRTQAEDIIDGIETVEEFVALWNKHCGESEHLYLMEEFDKLMEGESPWDIATFIDNGDFHIAHDYLRIDRDLHTLHSYSAWGICDEFKDDLILNLMVDGI